MEPRPGNHRLRLFVVVGGMIGLALGGLILALLLPKDKRHVPESWPITTRDPVRIDVIAQHPDASAEEVERQVAIPLEVALAGVERLEILRSKSVLGSAYVQAVFQDGAGYTEARQEIINRLQFVGGLPAGVSPQLSPAASPAAFRYTLHSPKDPMGRDIYTLHDLRAVQDWFLEREFRRIPRILDVVSSGGTVCRYEVRPDPERMTRYGITLPQLQAALRNSNGNVAGGLPQGDVLLNVRGVGLFGGGQDPFQKAGSMDSPAAAAAFLRAEEQKRLGEIRDLVIASVNNVPICIGDIVEGGRLRAGEVSTKGAVVGHQPRAERVGISRPLRDGRGERVWEDHDDCVQGVILVRRGEDAGPAFQDIRTHIEQLGKPEALLPGVRLKPYLEVPGGADHFWVRAHFPMNISEQGAVDALQRARTVVRRSPEVDLVVSQTGGLEEGPPSGGWTVGLLCVRLRPAAEWPNGADNRPRTKTELMDAVAYNLNRHLPGVDWACLSHYRPDLSGSFDACAEEAVLKLAGPDLNELEKLAEQAKKQLLNVAGVRGVHVLHSRGLSQSSFRIDLAKCKRWGVNEADVRDVLRMALSGNALSTMIEGEQRFDITLCWPDGLRRNEEALLSLPLDVIAPGDRKGLVPRLRLRDVVTPLGENGARDEGVAAIYREQGQRVLLVRVGVQGREQSTVRAEGEHVIAPLLKAGYRQEWSCEH